MLICILPLQDISLSNLSVQETVEQFVAAYNAATQGGDLRRCRQCLGLLHSAAKDQVCSVLGRQGFLSYLHLHMGLDAAMSLCSDAPCSFALQDDDGCIRNHCNECHLAACSALLCCLPTQTHRDAIIFCCRVQPRESNSRIWECSALFLACLSWNQNSSSS